MYLANVGIHTNRTREVDWDEVRRTAQRNQEIWNTGSDQVATQPANQRTTTPTSMATTGLQNNQPATNTTQPVNRYADFNAPDTYLSSLQQAAPGSTQEMFTVSDKAPLANIGMHFNSNPFSSWKTSEGGFDEAQFNSYNSVGGVPLYRKNIETGQWEINPDGRLGELNKQFEGLNFRLENDPYAEDYQDGRPSLQLKWDNSVLPKDRFGNQGTSVDPIGFEDGRNGTLRYPGAVYDDPFYGRITDPRNMQQHQGWFDKFNEMLLGTPLLVSLAAGGLGGALGGAGALAGGISPSNALLGGQIVNGIANGADWESFIPMLISAGFSLSGANEFLGKLAPYARQAATVGAGQIVNRGRP